MLFTSTLLQGASLWLDNYRQVREHPAQHPAHVERLMAGYELIDSAAERFAANASLIAKAGRPPRIAKSIGNGQSLDIENGWQPMGLRSCKPKPG